MKKNNYNLGSNLFFIIKNTFKFDKKIIFTLIALVPIRVLLPLLEVYIPKILVDDIEHYNALEKIWFDVTIMTIILVLGNIFINKLSSFIKVKSKQQTKNFEWLFSSKIMEIEYEKLSNSNSKTEYQKAKNSLSEFGIYGLITSSFDLLTNLLGFISFIRIIFSLNWIIVPLLIFIEIIGGILALLTRNLDQKTKSSRALADRRIRYINNVSKDYISAKDIRIFSMAGFLYNLGEKFVNNRKAWVSKQYKYYFINSFSAAIISLIMSAGTYIYLVFAMFKNEINAGDVVLYLGVILGFGKWLNGIADTIDLIGRSNRATKDIRKFLEQDIFYKCENYTNNKQEEFINSSVSLKNVSFRYPSQNEYTLSNINLDIQPGEKVAIVGTNGAGKTTLINLICGLICPTEGTVCVDGNELSKLAPSIRYKKTSAVFQDIKWMPTSILENITMTEKEKCDIDRVYDILDEVGLADKIEALPQKVFTPLSISLDDSAVQLSGGELQKLAMARALYKESSLLVLDEPTAALDPISENEIYSKYNEISNNKTTIFVSHRLASTKFCERIILLDNGKIIEEGTHEELIKLNGKYAYMFKIQSLYYSNEDVNQFEVQ